MTSNVQLPSALRVGDTVTTLGNLSRDADGAPEASELADDEADGVESDGVQEQPPTTRAPVRAVRIRGSRFIGL